MMCRWKNSTSTIKGTVTTPEAAAMSPQGMRQHFRMFYKNFTRVKI